MAYEIVNRLVNTGRDAYECGKTHFEEKIARSSRDLSRINHIHNTRSTNARCKFHINTKFYV